MAYTREPLSGGTHGVGVKIAATSTPGTTIHTAQASTTLVDVVTLYAYNDSTAAVTLTIEYGGTTDPDNLIVQSIPPQAGLIPIVADLVLRNSLVIKGFASSANVVVVYGFVNVEA